MNAKKIYLIHDYVSLLVQFILVYFVQTFINISSSHNANYYYGFLYIPILLTSYLSLKHLKTIIIPLILFAVYYVSFFILKFTVAETACYVIITSIIFILFLKKWNDKLNSTYTITPTLAFLLLFVLISVNPNMKTFSLSLGLAYLVTIFLEKYIKNLCSYCNNNANIDKLPIYQIIRTNINSIFIFIFICLITYLLIRIFNIDNLLYNLFFPIIKAIKDALISFLNKIIRFLSTISAESVDVEINNTQEEFDFGTNSNGQPSLFWRIVSILSNTLKAIVCIYLIYKALNIIYEFFTKNFTKKMNDSDTITNIRKTDNILATKLPKKMIKFLKSKDNNTKIRNVYIKLVSSSKLINQNNINSMTAEEMSNKIAKDKSLDDFINIYEKARYSNKECSKEELKKAKKSL